MHDSVITQDRGSVQAYDNAPDRNGSGASCGVCAGQLSYGLAPRILTLICLPVGAV